MMVDFVHFASLYVIFMVILRLLQARFAGTEFGKCLAFFG
jgi:hypothetical protein